MERVPGTPGVNVLPGTVNATNARGWDTMAGCVTPNLRTGPSRVLKLYWLKLYMRQETSLKTACKDTLLPI